MLERYLSRHVLRNPIISSPPKKDVQLIVVIPVYNETSILPALNSLQACRTIEGTVEVICVFNAAENEEKAVLDCNNLTMEEARKWHQGLTESPFELHFIVENNLPKKHAGVGLARKIGMDEAIRRFQSIQKNKGVIVCFDADSQCEPNYFQAISNHFNQHPKSPACSIYFEHPLEGNEFEDDIYRGIMYYELHLRYYINALAFAQLPYAFHTVGSSMAVTAEAYCQQGGMNKLKAGEDFYFLQKFIKLGTFTELNETKVIPSPRISDRVPFGTGRAIKEMRDGMRNVEESYAFESFELIKELFKNVADWYTNEPQFSSLFIDFVGQKKWEEKLHEIRSQSTSKDAFTKRFFLWFDAFQLLKFLHYLRDNHFPQQPLIKSVVGLLQKNNISIENKSAKGLLTQLRKMDRGVNHLMNE